MVEEQATDLHRRMGDDDGRVRRTLSSPCHRCKSVPRCVTVLLVIDELTVMGGSDGGVGGRDGGGGRRRRHASIVIMNLIDRF